jgi:CBS domain-containing protein
VALSLKQQLRRGLVRQLDLKEYVTADEGTPVREVLYRMRVVDCSTALITREERLAGVFTERDVLRKVVNRPDTWDRPIRDFMTREPVALQPSATVLAAVHLMNEGSFRDIPVVDESGRVLGNLTDNAVARYLCDGMQAEVMNLPPNPDQVPRTVEGA